MKRFLAALGTLALLSWLAPPAFAQTAGTTRVLSTCSTASYIAGKFNYPTQDLNGNACVVGTFSFTPSGTQNVNLTQILGAAPSLTNPLFIANAEAADVSGTFTNATQTTSVTNSSADGYAAGLISVNGTYGTASGVFEVSDDAGATWYSVICGRSDGTASETGYTTLTNINRQWSCPVGGNDSLRIRSTAVASGTVNARVGISAPPPSSTTTFGNVTTTPSGVTTTDKSLTLTSGGVAQAMIALNASRKVYCVQNPSTTASGVAAESVWVRVNGTAAANVGTELANGAQACESGPTIDTAAVSVFAATTGHKINGFEKQ